MFICQSTVSNIVSEVSNLLNKKLTDYIRFPESEFERTEISNRYMIYGEVTS